MILVQTMRNQLIRAWSCAATCRAETTGPLGCEPGTAVASATGRMPMHQHLAIRLLVPQHLPLAMLIDGTYLQLVLTGDSIDCLLLVLY